MPNSFTPQQIEQFMQEFFDVVGARQYIGARYVPIFGRAGEDTVEWDDRAPYEPLTVVMHQGVSYVSRRYVPAGIQITDTDYWVETYRFNAQVEQYRQEVLGFQGQIDQVREDMESDYVPFPDPDTYPKYGLLGQVLTTLTGGGTKWEDPVTVDAAIAEPLIEEWLDTHPEATTTVEDGAITYAKLNQSLVNRLVHSSGKYQQHSSHDISDANDQANNSICFIATNITESDIANLPAYGNIAILYKVNFSGTQSGGYIQYYVTADQMWYREGHDDGGTPAIGDWRRVYPLEKGSVNYNNLSESATNRLVHSSGKFQQHSSHDISDANDQANNSICFIATDITESDIANLPAYGVVAILYKVNFSGTATDGLIQYYVSTDQMWYREEHGSGDTPTFGDWHRVYPLEDASVSYNNLSESATNRLVHSSGKYQQHSSHDISDANDQANNSICFIATNITESDIANLPAYGNIAILYKVNFSGTQSGGYIQYYVTADQMWYREGHNEGTTPVIGNWRQVYPLEDGTLNKLLHSSGKYQQASSHNIDDADDQPNNSVCFISANITATDIANLPAYGVVGLLYKVNFSGVSSGGFIQYYVSTDQMWYREEHDESGTPTFGDWHRVYPDKTVTNQHTCNIFRKVVCVGDSYTAGYIQDTSAPAAITNEDYAWPHYMETITGNEYVNCGASGSTTLDWVTNERGLPKAQQSGVSQAYIIGLMINDVSNSVPVGTIANIEDVTPTTYYAGLGNIVRQLHTISPNAHIFIQTCPRTDTRYPPYNQAVRDVVSYYASTMNTHLLDLYDYIDMYEDESITGDRVHGHYTAIAYQQFAEILSHILSDYINDHISAFQHVYALPYD